MTQINKTAEQILDIARQLELLARSLQITPDVPESVQADVDRKLKRRECLVCGQRNEERYSRGQCQKCYNRLRRKIRENELPEELLIKRGLLLPPGRGGRPKTDDDIERNLAELVASLKLEANADSLAQKADDAASRQERRRGAKKRRNPKRKKRP